MKKFLFIFFYCLISFQSFAIEINQEFLNQFNGIALKTIRKSETLRSKSSQREIYGVKEIANILGEDRKVFDIEIIYLDDNSETSDLTTVIWYNSRPERKNGDYRLKYKKLNPTLLMKDGDIALSGVADKDKLKLIITEKNSKYASQLSNLLQDNRDQEIPQEKDSIYSNTSNLKKYEDLKIYKNIDTNKIVIVGKATKVKDGDTLVISDLFNVRMLGIDPPESKQLCKNKDGKLYKCGEKTT